MSLRVWNNGWFRISPHLCVLRGLLGDHFHGKFGPFFACAQLELLLEFRAAILCLVLVGVIIFMISHKTKTVIILTSFTFHAANFSLLFICSANLHICLSNFIPKHSAYIHFPIAIRRREKKKRAKLFNLISIKSFVGGNFWLLKFAKIFDRNNKISLP